nr:hypothetical protein [Nocardia carnea]
MQLENDEQSSDPAVAVVERMQGLELVVRHSCHDQRVDVVVGAHHPIDQVANLCFQIDSGRRGDEAGVVHACATMASDDHLGGSDPAGLAGVGRCPLHQGALE